VPSVEEGGTNIDSNSKLAASAESIAFFNIEIPTSFCVCIRELAIEKAAMSTLSPPLFPSVLSLAKLNNRANFLIMQNKE
jgi:hypothetical protein